MKTTVIYTLCILAVISLSDADHVTCWLCVGTLNSDCARGEEVAMVPMQCPDYDERNTTNLGTSLFSIGDKSNKALKNEYIDTVCVSMVSEQMGTPFIERNCGYIFTGVDICEYMDEMGFGLSYCSSCGESLCNNYPPTP